MARIKEIVGIHVVLLFLVILNQCACQRQNRPGRQLTFQQKIQALNRRSARGTEHSFEYLFSKIYVMSRLMPELPEGSEEVTSSSEQARCSRPSDLKSFFEQVNAILKELRDEYLEDVPQPDSEDSSSQSDDAIETLEPTDASTTDKSDDNGEDSVEPTSESDTANPTDGPEGRRTTVREYMDRRRRSVMSNAYNLDEILDRLDTDSMDCLTLFMNKPDKRFLCLRFAQRSSSVFSMLLEAGIKCENFMMGAKSNGDDKLDMPQQLAIFKRLMDKPSDQWSKADVDVVVKLAPDVVDDDFLEKLPEHLFRTNIKHFGRMAASRNSNPRLRYAIRQKLSNLNLPTMTAQEISDLGPGLLSLRVDQIEDLDGNSLLNAGISSIFEEGDSSESTSEEESEETTEPSTGIANTTVNIDGTTFMSEEVEEEEEEEEEDDESNEIDNDIRFSIGRRIKDSWKGRPVPRASLGRAMRLLHDDFQFVQMCNPNDLVATLPEIRSIKYGEDEARSIFKRMRRSTQLPQPDQMSAQNLINLGQLVKGMGVSEIKRLNKQAVNGAISKLKNIEFDDDQAEELLDDLLDEDIEDLPAQKVMALGNLVKGFRANQFQQLAPNVVEEVLDKLNDLDLSDAKKRIIAEKARMSQGGNPHPKFLELNHFAEAVSVADLNAFNQNDIQNHINTTSRIRWRLPQASALAKLYKKGNGGKRLRLSDIAVMGYVVKGLLPEDLEDMMTSRDDVFNVAESLKDKSESITSAQLDILVDTFEALNERDPTELVIDEAKAMQGALILAHMNVDQFNQLKFTPGGRMAFLRQAAKMPTNKMSRQHIQFMAQKMLDVMEADSAENSLESPEERDSRQLRSLGNMALGLQPSQIEEMSGQAIIDNLDILRTLPLSRDQSVAILAKVDEVAGNWKCRSDMLVRVGPLLQHSEEPYKKECKEQALTSFTVTMEDMEKRRENAEERTIGGYTREDDDSTDDAGEKRMVVDLMESGFAFSISRTRRSATSTTGPLTCDIIQRLKSSARHVEPQAIMSMANAEFINCLATLGSISNWPTATMDALANKAKQIFNEVNTWTGDVVRRAGSIVSGISPAEIKTMQIDGVDTLYSLGKHGRMNLDQLKAGFQRWIGLRSAQTKDVSSITEGELSSLSEFVCGLQTREIPQIADSTFRRSIDVISRAKSCTPEQKKAYAAKMMTVYGNKVAQWTPAEVGDMGALLGHMRSQHIQALEPRQLSALTPAVIQEFPREGLAAMTPVQLKAFSTNQANAVTEVQYNSLNPEQQTVLNDKASVAFLTSKTKPTGQGTNGATGVITTLPAIFLSLALGLMVYFL